jgi:alkylation response protein AidB-like acyl-CoA dehydrogenase
MNAHSFSAPRASRRRATGEHEWFSIPSPKSTSSFASRSATSPRRSSLPTPDAWEEAELFPNEVFKWAGDRGIIGAHFSEEFGGGGGDFWMSIVKAEELPRNNSAGVTMGLLVQSDMATPVIHDIGTREQKEEFLRPGHRR